MNGRNQIHNLQKPAVNDKSLRLKRVLVIALVVITCRGCFNAGRLLEGLIFFFGEVNNYYIHKWNGPAFINGRSRYS